MSIEIDLTSILAFISQPADIMMMNIFWTVGWIPLGIALLIGFKDIWMEYIQNKWVATQKFTLLAIDIPRGNEQSPMAVENMFAYLAGTHGSLNLLDIYWDGKFQLSFSFEIVSIDGYTQFLIRTPIPFRNLVETAIYSQYPDAEITEVGDYTEGMPRKYPDDDYDVWGAEFIQTGDQAFPIKVYQEFEHQFGKPETTFRDPMATLMDLCSSLRRGEQLWYQIIVKPIDMNAWTTIGDVAVKKILKEEMAPAKNIIDNAIDGVLGVMGFFSEVVYSMWSGITEAPKEEKKEDALKMMNLKPKEKKQVEAAHNKISKIGFECKLRFVYIAKKDVMNKPKVANGFVGYMKQFTALDLNSFKPDTKKTMTSTAYFFKESRLNKKKSSIVRNYMNRDGFAGRLPGILNTEELATIWHFPIESVVKAPLIQKAPGRKAEPPSSLPVGAETVSEDLLEPLESIFEEEPAPAEFIAPQEQIRQEKKESKKDEIEKGTPPANLPFA
ncbi:MAG: hypothetical protein AAB906_04685 [Patescibacteria group bacterium]